jgi:hypothetical protein
MIMDEESAGSPRLRILTVPDNKVILIYDRMPEMNDEEKAHWHRSREILIGKSNVVAVQRFEHELDIEAQWKWNR